MPGRRGRSGRARPVPGREVRQRLDRWCTVARSERHDCTRPDDCAGRAWPAAAADRDGCAMNTARTMTLDQALETLVAVAESAGVQAETARGEGSNLAAAVAESAPGAAAAWATAVGGGTTQDFFDAATRGRRWRAAPTATLGALVAQGSTHSVPYAQALAEVVSAACDLGEPTMRVIGNASVAAAAQLTAAGVRPAPPDGTTPDSAAPGSPACAPAPSDQRPEPGRQPAQEAPAKADTPRPPEPAQRRSVEELLAELDALIGLERVKAEIHRQVAILRVERLRTCLLYTSPSPRDRT